MNFTYRNSCPICGKKKALVPFLKLQHSNILECKDCHFHFLQNIKVKSYVEDLDYTTLPHLLGNYCNAKINLKYLKRAKVFLKNSNIKYLDIGTSYGFLMDFAREKLNFEAEGVELGVTMADTAEKLGFTIYRKPIENLNFKNKYDLISIMEVIEHIEDVKSFLSDTKRLLKKNGLVIIKTDNFYSWIVKTLKEGFWKYIPFEHINYFSFESLEKLLAQFGFKCIARYYEVPLSNYLWWSRGIITKFLNYQNFYNNFIKPNCNASILHLQQSQHLAVKKFLSSKNFKQEIIQAVRFKNKSIRDSLNNLPIVSVPVSGLGTMMVLIFKLEKK